MHPPLRLVIFGWRGVLWDNLGVEYQAIYELFCKHGKPTPGRSEYQKGRGPDFAEFCYTHNLPRYVSREEVAETRRRVANQHPEFLNIFEGVQPTLATCHNRGLVVAIVSKEPTAIIEERLFQFDLGDFVHTVRGGKGNRAEKLLEVINLHKVEPAETLFIEDTRDGLMTGKEVGMRTLGVTYGHNDRETILRAQPEFPNMAFRRTACLWDVRKIICSIKRDEGR